MLTFVLTEQEQTIERGLQASTFVAQPFWQEMQKYFVDAVQERLKAMEDGKYASPEVKADLIRRWIITKEIVARIERIPQAAIEAARELGEGNVRQAVQGSDPWS
jgi:hypothetical protein